MAIVGTWNRWFAWRPVVLPGGRFAWMRYVERRVTIETVRATSVDPDWPGDDRVDLRTYQYREHVS